MRRVLVPVPADVLLALVVTGLTVATFLAWRDGPLSLRALVLAVLSAAPLALRQRAPVTTMSVIIAALVLYALLRYGEWPNSGIGMVVAMFTVATLRPRRTAAVMYLATIGTAAVAYLTFPQPITWSEIVQFALIMAAAWALGESTRRWAARTERLATASVEAVTQERIRIAREMHDIVSHHMSVISVQAGLADYVLDSDPTTARAAITTVGSASREALSEMRRLLDVLRVDRHGDEDVDYRPQPGLADLGELIGRTRTAGLAVDLTVTGPVRPLPAGPDLCAYRIVQESLTNVLKHAGPAHAWVEVEYGDLTLSVTVTDNGTKAQADHPSSASLGIRGMRERAELYGGVLTAKPCPGDGYRVVLRLPTDETATTVQEKQ